MFKILIYIPVWGREKTVRKCFEGLNLKVKGFSFKVFCVISEDWAEKMCKEFGFKYVFSENKPLGRKLNNGLKEALKEDFDYMMTSGSDNLYHKDLFEIYRPHMGKIDLFGVDKVVFFNSKAKIVDYDKMIIGAGRMIRKEKLIEASRRQLVRFTESCSGVYSFQKGKEYWIHVKDVKGFPCEVLSGEEVKFWDDEKNNALDYDTNLKLFLLGASNYALDTGSIPYVVDIKTEDNIWKYEDFRGQEINVNHVKKRFCAVAL